MENMLEVFGVYEYHGLKILSCGSGMQSSALALMSCENKNIRDGISEELPHDIYHELVPIYDAIIFCDLGLEPEWVLSQTLFIKRVAESVGIPFVIIKSPLYEDYMNNFGKSRVTSIPFWTLDEEGKKGKMMRNCTLDYKIGLISKYVRSELLHYKKGQRTKEIDMKAHEMHIGFSKEEERRCKDNPHPMFVNRFPLCEMGLTRADNYAYIKDVWGLETKASACCFCPFHTNFFFQYSKENDTEHYHKTLLFDEMLEREQPNTKIRSKLFISKSRKRIKDLLPEDCQDMECFKYRSSLIWNGF